MIYHLDYRCNTDNQSSHGNVAMERYCCREKNSSNHTHNLNQLERLGRVLLLGQREFAATAEIVSYIVRHYQQIWNSAAQAYPSS